MINTLLTMTLTGSTVVLAWLAADKLAGKRLSPIWHERILRLALLFMLVPVGSVWTEVSKLWSVGVMSHAQTSLPGTMPAPPAMVPDTVIAVLPGVLPEVTVVPPAQSVQMTVSADIFLALTIFWGMGAAVTLLRKLWAYRRFKKLLRGERNPLPEDVYAVFERSKKELGAGKGITAFVVEGLPTPMVVGLLCPTVLLPRSELSETELRCLFLHELTHIRRHDLWVRFFALLAVVLHWYNPLVYLLDRALKERGEQSCDERVARPMSPEERLVYGGMLLKLAAEPGLKSTGWAVTLSTRESVRKRLGSIIKAGHWTTTDKVVALFVAVGLILCGVMVACSVREPIGVAPVSVPQVREETVSTPESKPQPEQETLERRTPEVARYGHAKALTEMDWENMKVHLTEGEAQALDIYLPVLEGETFLWLTEGEQVETDFQGLLDSMFRADGYQSETVYVEAVLFADLFQRGEENMCVLLPHLGYYWIILHRENGVFYAIDLPVRWFGDVQKDGLYAGSGGASHSHYKRLRFEQGTYYEVDLAEVRDGVLYIEGEAKSAAEYEAWKKANLTQEAFWYVPSGARYGVETAEPEGEYVADSEMIVPQEPSEEPQSKLPAGQAAEHTATIGGVDYETYVDNLGTMRLKDSVGEADRLYITDLFKLDSLVDGKYPVNSLGETYGWAELADYVGEAPKLMAVDGSAVCYVWWEDYYADFSDPAVAERYESYYTDVNWLGVSEAEPISGWYIPLYDAQHREIGKYPMERTVSYAESSEIRALEDAARREEGEPHVDTIQTDEMEEPVPLTGGAVIVDGVAYPRPANNHGQAVISDLSGGLAPHEQAVLDALPNGTYPQNSRGEYYGSDEVAFWLNIEPDLILATGTEGQEGYVWWEDTKIRFERLADLEKVVWNEEGYLIPLYDSEHIQIGWKQEETPFYNVNGDFIQITQETVDALRALLS